MDDIKLCKNQHRGKQLACVLFFGTVALIHQGCTGFTSFGRSGNSSFSSISHSVKPIATGLRRLSVHEADQSILKVFKDSTFPASQTLPEDDLSPFDNDYRLQKLTVVNVRAMEDLAFGVASRLTADTTRLNEILDCAVRDEQCLTDFISRVGQQIFRRPLPADEVDTFLNMTSQWNTFEDKIDGLVRLFLQSPYFWIISEVGEEVPGQPEVRKLSDVELASRISYFVVGTPPDKQLMQAAIDGRLKGYTSLKHEVERLLATPEAIAQTDRMHAMWLGYNKMQLSAELISGMREETRALIQKVLFDENGMWTDLFRSSQTYIDDALAVHYDLKPTGLPGKHWVDYENSGRQGILSHGSFLSAAGKFGGTSPTQRGYHIRKNLFCQPVAPPPPDVSADDPPPETEEAKCKIARYKANTMRPGSSCVGCHAQMDPIGFGLENFSASGQFLPFEVDKPECIIEGQGELVGIGEFSGPRQLSDLLLEVGAVEGCLVTRTFEFAFGRRLVASDTSDQNFKNYLINGFKNHGNYRQLLVDIVTSSEFALRREDRGE